MNINFNGINPTKVKYIDKNGNLSSPDSVYINGVLAWVSTIIVTFVDWDGTVLKTEELEAGGSATPPADPSRTGYTFDTWSGTYTNVETSQTVTATYTINTYTVNFYDSDNTTILKTETVDYGSDATPPPDPTKTGETFTGWDKSYTNVTTNLEIYPTFAVTTYTVSFYDYDGTTLLKEDVVAEGADATPPTDPTRTAYDFSGWSGNYTAVTQDETVLATYTPTVYNITYVMNGGANHVSNPSTYTIESSTITLLDPTAYTKEGYTITFDSWSPGNTIPSGSYGDKTFTANWVETPKTYTITFNVNGGDSLSFTEKTVTYDSQYGEFPTAQRTDYELDGWAFNSNGTSPVTPTDIVKITADDIIYAIWNLGTIDAPSIAHLGDTTSSISVRLTNNDHRAVRIFYSTSNINPGNGDSYVDVTASPSYQDAVISGLNSGTVYDIYARTGIYNYDTNAWEYSNSIVLQNIGTDVTATFVDYNGDPLETDNVEYGGLPSATAPTRVGYTFNGWSPALGTITSDTTYTATYTANTYTITYDANGGTNLSATSKVVTYDDTYGTLATVDRGNYTFDGWALDTGGVNMITSSTIVDITSDTTVYAIWSFPDPATPTITGTSITSTGITAYIDNNDDRNINAFYSLTDTTPDSGDSYDLISGNGSGSASKTGLNNGSNYTLYVRAGIYNSETGLWKYSGTTSVNFTTDVIATFNADGSNYATIDVPYNTAPGNPGTPTKTGYTFSGWSPNTSDPITENTIYTGTFAANTYTVTLDANGGTGGTTSVQATYDSPMPSANAPTREHYTFNGYTSLTTFNQYYTSSMASARNWDIAENHTLVAGWTLQKTDDPSVSLSYASGTLGYDLKLTIINNDDSEVSLTYSGSAAQYFNLPATLAAGASVNLTSTEEVSGGLSFTIDVTATADIEDPSNTVSDSTVTP